MKKLPVCHLIGLLGEGQTSQEKPNNYQTATPCQCRRISDFTQ